MLNKRIVIVGGCGHVGLPLGIVFAAKSDFEVTLLDIDETKVRQVNSGVMPFMEQGAEGVLREVIGKRLWATIETSCLRSAGTVITVVGTPVDEHLNPTVHALYRSVDQLLEQMQDGALLILRSTVYPGVTGLVRQRIRSKRRDIQLAFCPERIAEGRAIEELVQLPQIVAAFDPEAQNRAKGIFQ